jgi:tetratricopeptide (TPR) repeat protein
MLRYLVQEAVTTDSILHIRKSARMGDVCDDARLVKIRHWLQGYLSKLEQQALGRLWMFKGGFGDKTAVDMLDSAGGDALDDGERKVDAMGMLRDLINTSCLQRLSGPDVDEAHCYTMHPLVREMSRGMFEQLPEPERAAILQKFTDHMGAVADRLIASTTLHKAAQVLADEMLNFQVLRSLIRKLGGWSGMPAHLSRLNHLAVIMLELGQHAEAAQLLKEVVRLSQELLSAKSPDTLGRMNNLAKALSDMGQHAEAAKLYREVLQLRQEIYGPKHLDVLASMSNLATVLDAIGQHKEAARMHRGALELRREVLGDRHPHTLISMNNLAVMHLYMRQYPSAAKQLREVVQRGKEVLGEGHPVTLSSMNNLALAYGNMGMLVEAAKYHKCVLQARQELFGKQHPNTLTSMANYALALRDMGQHAECQALFSEMLALQRQVLGARHPDTLRSMSNCAVALQASGKLAEAAKQHRDVLVLMKQMLGEDHVDTLTSMNNLALALGALGQHAEAADVFAEVLQRRFGLSAGLCSPGICSSLPASLLAWESKKKIRRPVPAGCQKIGSRSSLDLVQLISIDHLIPTVVWWCQAPVRAKPARTPRVLYRQQSLGEKHSETVGSMANLAQALHRTGQQREAVRQQRGILELMRKEKGPEHRDTLAAMSRLAVALSKMRQHAEATQIHEKVCVPDLCTCACLVGGSVRGL